MPTQEDLQKLHDQNIAALERNMAEARRVIEVNIEQIKLIRRYLGLQPDFMQGQEQGQGQGQLNSP